MARTSGARTLIANPRHHYVMGSGSPDKRLQVRWHKGKRDECTTCITSKNGNAPGRNIPLPKGWYC